MDCYRIPKINQICVMCMYVYALLTHLDDLRLIGRGACTDLKGKCMHMEPCSFLLELLSENTKKLM